jgi:hypothetical protein
MARPEPSEALFSRAFANLEGELCVGVITPESGGSRLLPTPPMGK